MAIVNNKDALFKQLEDADDAILITMKAKDLSITVRHASTGRAITTPYYGKEHFLRDAEDALSDFVLDNYSEDNLLNTTIRFTNGDDYFIEGKAYQVIYGKIKCENGTPFPLTSPFRSMRDLREYFSDVPPTHVGFPDRYSYTEKLEFEVV